MFLDSAYRFVDEVHKRCFEANALDHIERPTVLSLGAFVFDEVDAATRVPKRRIFGKKQQTSHVGSRWTPRGIHQMIRVSENNLRRPSLESGLSNARWRCGPGRPMRRSAVGAFGRACFVWFL